MSVVGLQKSLFTLCWESRDEESLCEESRGKEKRCEYEARSCS